ncbi:MAG: HEAT repeat domain-containing protein [Verrucomicrobiota bacterium]
MKTTTKVWLGAGAVLALVVALIGYKIKTAEPSYQGKSLSEWLGECNPYEVPSVDGSYPSTNNAFASAMRAMGTNSLPILIEWLPPRNPTVQNWLIKANNKQDFIRLPTGSDPRTSSYQAVAAIAALGPSAKPAIPQLVELLNHTNVTVYATAALVAIGPEAHPVILQALRHTNSAVRVAVIWGLGQMPGDKEFAVPSLISLLNDNDTGVRRRAAFLIGCIQRKPEITIPALLKAFPDPDPHVSSHLAFALSRFGTNAVAALPALRQLQAQTNLDFIEQFYIKNALRKISPSEYPPATNIVRTRRGRTAQPAPKTEPAPQ